MDCPRIPEMSYREFSARLHEQVMASRIPLSPTVEITERCNLRCAHCYINRPAADRKVRKRELSFSGWARIIDELTAEGSLWLLLTGGEPLLHPDFRDIYTHAKKRGMIITLFTNGTLISPEMADFLEDLPPFSVEITVYGRTQGTYEAVTGVPGSYEKCLRGIDLLLDRKVRLELKTVAMTLNAHELGDLKAWAKNLGSTFRFDPVLSSRLDGGRAPVAVRLPLEEVVKLDLQDEERMRNWRRYLDKFLSQPRSDRLYYCGAGVNSCHVDSYGQLFICIMSRAVGYDLTAGSFREGWVDFLPKLRRLKIREDYPCNRCNLNILCEQCPGWALVESGDPETPVDYLCRLAHLRAQAFGIVTASNT